MTTVKRGQGEQTYVDSFIVKDFINSSDRELIKDYLYKFSFNLSEAYEYLFLVSQCNDIEAEWKSELFYRIYGMALQCLALCIRKMTDASSERSVRKLVAITEKYKVAVVDEQQIEIIYRHYDKFLNKFVVHQDVHSINDGVSFFPDTKVVVNDLERLRSYYLGIAQSYCNGYIDVSGEGHYYGFDLEKIVKFELSPDEY